MVALVAMSTTSFAQNSELDRLVSEVVSSYRASNVSYSAPSVSYSVPSVSYSVPSVTYNVPSISYKEPTVVREVPTLTPSTVNALTTTVNGYFRNNGTYVESHIRTMPNSTNWDNYSTKGNVNPFTGSTGYRARDYSSEALNYGAGHTIHTGPRGGQYYYNSRGNKTYVPKRNMW